MPVITDLNACRDALKRELDAAKVVVPFTGAGISTDAGIPDFRSPDSLWKRHKPISFEAFLQSPEMRAEAWRRKFAMDDSYAGARPTLAHRVLADWVASGKTPLIVTQNIDGLHQAAGVPEDKIVELHGNGTFARCLSCERRYELDEIRPVFEASGVAPVCGDCGGAVKSATISFGQPMPPGAMKRAAHQAMDCDLMVVLGSSLVVFPAAGVPIMAKKGGFARLVIVNREPTNLDDEADLVLRGEIGAIFQDLAGSAAA